MHREPSPLWKLGAQVEAQTDHLRLMFRSGEFQRHSPGHARSAKTAWTAAQFLSGVTPGPLQMLTRLGPTM
jgi:hypothetical protein